MSEPASKRANISVVVPASPASPAPVGPDAQRPWRKKKVRLLIKLRMPPQLRHDHQRVEEDAERDNDKWIVCGNCKNMQNIYPYFPGDKRVSKYEELAYGENQVKACYLCPGICMRCNGHFDDSLLLECDSLRCFNYVCFGCAKIDSEPVGPFWCTPKCERINEKVCITHRVLPWCTQALLTDADKGNPPSQYWAVCKTCMITVCITCGTVCHDGHEVVPAVSDKGVPWYGSTRCRCGQLECCTPLGPLRNKAQLGVQLQDAVLAEIKVSDKYIEAKKQVELARSKDPTLAARLGALKAEQERLASRLKDIGGTLSDSDAIVGSLYSDLQKARGTDDEDRIKSARNKAVVDNETLQRKFDEVRRQLNDCGNQIAKTERLIVDNQTDERSAIANVVQLKKDRQKAAKLVRTVAQAVGKDP